MEKVQKYYVDFGTGAGNFELEGTLEEAVKAAIDDIAYTQCDIEIKKDFCKQVNIFLKRHF